MESNYYFFSSVDFIKYYDHYSYKVLVFILETNQKI